MVKTHFHEVWYYKKMPGPFEISFILYYQNSWKYGLTLLKIQFRLGILSPNLMKSGLYGQIPYNKYMYWLKLRIINLQDP